MGYTFVHILAGGFRRKPSSLLGKRVSGRVRLARFVGPSSGISRTHFYWFSSFPRLKTGLSVGPFVGLSSIPPGLREGRVLACFDKPGRSQRVGTQVGVLREQPFMGPRQDRFVGRSSGDGGGDLRGQVGGGGRGGRPTQPRTSGSPKVRAKREGLMALGTRRYPFVPLVPSSLASLPP